MVGVYSPISFLISPNIETLSLPEPVHTVQNVSWGEKIGAAPLPLPSHPIQYAACIKEGV